MTDSPPDINNNEHAHRRRKLLGIINSLRGLGFNEHLRLPQMVCVGSQSVGKSSVIEALAQINLPRDAGTCTRCPIECRLKHTPDNAWQAQVLLRFETDETRRSGEVAFGDLITDRLALQDRIMRAQKAVLQPTVPSSRFLSEDIASVGSSFTRSCVVVELSGEDLTDLTFIDLPGLIANSSDAMTDSDIQLVEDLVSSYISDSSSLILLVVSCETDFETHRSVHLARRHDPNGARTIGVLTKPDRIPTDEEEKWIEMVTGRSNRLQNGWYVVKQPSRKELRSSNHTWSRARLREQEFFENTAAWAPIVQQFQEKFGTKHLGDQLGNVLARTIQDMLPSILNEINRLIRENEIALGKLPKLKTGSARTIVRVLLDGFLNKVNRELVRGHALARKNGLLQQMHDVYGQMRKDLQGAALVFRPNETDAELPAPSFLPKDEPWLTRSTLNEMTLGVVAKDTKQVRTREFVDDVTFELKKDYISKVVQGWTQPTMSVLEDVYDKFYIILTRLIEEEFHAYRDGPLGVMVGDISTRVAELCKSEASTHLSALLEQEGEPYTVHEDQFRTYKQQFLQYYKGVCYPNGMPSGLQAMAEESSNPGGSGISHTSASSQDSAIEVMASTRAHYQIAYRRFSDNVPMTIDQYFIRGFGKQISFALYEGLRPEEGDSDEYYKSLLRESDVDAELRRELMAKRATLYAARREII